MKEPTSTSTSSLVQHLLGAQQTKLESQFPISSANNYSEKKSMVGVRSPFKPGPNVLKAEEHEMTTAVEKEYRISEYGQQKGRLNASPYPRSWNDLSEYPLEYSDKCNRKAKGQLIITLGYSSFIGENHAQLQTEEGREKERQEKKEGGRIEDGEYHASFHPVVTLGLLAMRLGIICRSAAVPAGPFQPARFVNVHVGSIMPRRAW